jgi:hypothetical protein
MVADSTDKGGTIDSGGAVGGHSQSCNVAAGVHVRTRRSLRVSSLWGCSRMSLPSHKFLLLRCSTPEVVAAEVVVQRRYVAKDLTTVFVGTVSSLETSTMCLLVLVLLG